MRSLLPYLHAFSRSIDRELRRKRGYGCVTYTTNGSHEDMTARHFLASRDALIAGFRATDWSAMRSFEALRKRGLELEELMFNATGGVNTHKGLLFLHLFLLEAWSAGLPFYGELRELSAHLRELAAPLQADYENPSLRAASYHQQGIADIRQIPLQGFEPLFAHLDQERDDDRLSLALIASTDDTTTMARSNLSTLREMQSRAKAVLAISDGSFEGFSKRADTSPRMEQAAEQLNAAYLSARLSTGGVADLFTTIRLLEDLRKEAS